MILRDQNVYLQIPHISWLWSNFLYKNKLNDCSLIIKALLIINSQILLLEICIFIFDVKYPKLKTYLSVSITSINVSLKPGHGQSVQFQVNQHLLIILICSGQLPIMNNHHCHRLALDQGQSTSSTQKKIFFLTYMNFNACSFLSRRQTIHPSVTSVWTVGLLLFWDHSIVFGFFMF